MRRATAARVVPAFPAYAAKSLWIRTKQGDVVPFRLNAVQKELHGRLEEQRRRTGRVRALILKARQPGVSTYVEGRFYWQVTHRRGVRAFILTHLRDATDTIFEMVQPDHERIRAEVENVRSWVVGIERRVAELAVELRERRKQTDEREAHTQKTIDRLTAEVTTVSRELATIKQQISRFVGGGRVLAYIVSGVGGLIVALLAVITAHLLRG